MAEMDISEPFLPDTGNTDVGSLKHIFVIILLYLITARLWEFNCTALSCS